MMKQTDLKTHWTPEEAHFILGFLDELRNHIWKSYGCFTINRENLRLLVSTKTFDVFSRLLVEFSY
ncbi:MAG: hypothetical protein CSA50_07475 [Gammaproteobacteria bacterium]|nr:MAG: hypothetical protein CSA50_07475 [Gammaproteobacteria bacterium]